MTANNAQYIADAVCRAVNESLNVIQPSVGDVVEGLSVAFADFAQFCSESMHDNTHAEDILHIIYETARSKLNGEFNEGSMQTSGKSEEI